MPRAQHALATTSFFARSTVQSRAGRPGGRPLRMRNKGCNGRATARVAPTEGYKECLAGGRTGASAPTEAYLAVRRGGALPLPRAGKSAKRCQWQMKRAGFEEVPRLADTTVTGNRLARRWAREPRPYESVTKGAGKNPPVTASPCQPPLGKGALVYGLPRARVPCRGCGKNQVGPM